MSPDILIIDDEPSFAKSLKRWLESKDYEIAMAHTATEGILAAKENPPKVILLDVNLPDRSGVSIVQDLKSIDEDIGILMVSASGDTNDVVSSIKYGASDYIPKPPDHVHLAEKISNLLEMHRQKKTKRQLDQERSFGSIIGNSPKIGQLISAISRVATSSATVLLRGESGTGKNLIAKLIHEHGSRKSGPFVTINCAAIPDTLLESELFGHEKGAFTGAVQAKPGKFELAHEGTIFLDEIGELAHHLQAKLLRVLQGQEFERVGGVRTKKVDVRIITATNRNLEQAIQDRRFREDLFFRLNVLPIVIPPLRERKDDIPLLAESFIQEYAQRENKEFNPLSLEILSLLKDYDWPGNIRELQNIIERAVVLGRQPDLKRADFALGTMESFSSDPVAESPTSVSSLKDLEFQSLMKALQNSKGNIQKAANELGISRGTIYRRLRKYNVDPRKS